MIQVTLGSYDLSQSNGVTISKATGLDQSPIRLSQSNITNRSGGNIYTQLYGMRSVSFEGILQGSTVAEYFTNRSAFTGAFGLGSKLLSVTNWDGTTRTVDCKVTQAPLYKDEMGRVTFTEFRVEVLCESPYLFGSEVSYSAILAPSGGAYIPAPIPTALGSGAGSDMTIVNGGSESAYADFTITPSTDTVSATLTNLGTGESFTIANTISAGDTVRVYKDSQGLHVLHNGTSDWTQYFTGTFFEITTGSNTISFTATSGTGTATALFSNPYLTI